MVNTIVLRISKPQVEKRRSDFRPSEGTLSLHGRCTWAEAPRTRSSLPAFGPPVADRKHAVIEGRRVDQFEFNLVGALEQALALPQDHRIHEQRELVHEAFAHQRTDERDAPADRDPFSGLILQLPDPDGSRNQRGPSPLKGLPQ